MLNLPKMRALLDARQPGHALPQGCYNDPDVFAFDLEAIHARHWILVGFDVELPAPGSTLSVPIGRSSVLIVRDRQGTLRGFHNTCRHRGAQLCPTGHGQRSWIICPYHQWTYDLDGRLANAPRMPETFDRAQHGLRPIHVETVAGSVYVCLADDPPAFQTFREQLTPLLAPHNLANAKLAFEGTLVERANWKLVMENARECYHCAVRHPELALTFPVKGRRSVQFADASGVDAFRARMAAFDLPIGPVEGVDYTIDGLTELWTKTNLQDLDLCENNQAGVNSRGYVPGPYCDETEQLVMRFVDWYCDEATRYIDRHVRVGPRLAAVAGGS